MEKQNKACYWFLFFQDKLLLKKNNGSYQIPYQENAPFGTDDSFEVVLDSSLPARAASLSHEITEDEQWIMIGLRASWNYLPLDWYKRAGKAHQLVHWDRNSRFCPACGKPLAWHTVISKYCDSCHQEFYPVISPAMIVLIRRSEEVLLVHARNFRGSFHGLVAGFLEGRNAGTMCPTGSDGRNRTHDQEYHLFWQSALALSERYYDWILRRL
jgi:NAD+ diphosphatase